MRQLDRVEMPLPEGATLLRPHLTQLTWLGHPRLRADIGQLCFLRRITSDRQRAKHQLEESSYSEDRARAVLRLVHCASERQRLGARPATVLSQLRAVMKFVAWADSNGLHLALCNIEASESAFAEFSRYQRDRISRNLQKKNSAAQDQRSIKDMLASFFEVEEFAGQIPAIRGSRKHTDPTRVPDESEQGILMAWCGELFDVISKGVLEELPYPLLLEGPTPDTRQARRVWLLPTYQYQSSLQKGTAPWNLDTGAVREYAELKAAFLQVSSKFAAQRANNARAGAKSKLDEANSSARSAVRLSDGNLAAACFGILLLAETGMNLAQLIDLRWGSDLEAALDSPEVVRQQFRRIKYRAGGRAVNFVVSLGFIPRLKCYLRLRAFLLNSDTHSEFLVRRAPDGSPASFTVDFIDLAQRRIKTRGIEIPSVSARMWRAAKQDWLVSNDRPEIAAEMMGHSLDTALKAYSNGTESNHRRELAAFFRSVERTVCAASERKADQLESAVGSCVNFKKPISIDPGAGVTPTCKSAEGCLFCDNYRVHADERDIRKLLSCRYCLRITSNRADSLEDYDRTFGAVLRRIEFLLSEIGKRNASLISDIERSVDVAGELDPFWSSKLEQLLELGLA